MSTTPFEFGDVLLLPFPFTDHTTSKRRPAIVVSNRRYNVVRPDVVVMAITSQLLRSTTSGDTWITYWLKPSVIKPVFATLEQRLVLRQLGSLHAEDQAMLRTTIADIIG